jgi:Zn-dependent protease with chaperone function
MAMARIGPEDIQSKNERRILYASVATLLVLFLFVLEISLGFVLLLVAVLALWVKVRQGQMLGQSIKVTDAQLPEVHGAVQDAAARLGMRAPDVFVTQDPVINAYALGFLGRKSVVLNSATVEAMEPDELRSILGHEFSHIKCDHTNWMVFTNLNETVRIPVASDVIGLIFLLWSRKAEYTGDRGGLLASRDLRASISALAKVAVGRQLFGRLNLEAFSQQREEVSQDDVSKLSEALSTHPYIVHRIHALREFAESEEYRRLAALHPGQGAA